MTSDSDIALLNSHLSGTSNLKLYADSSIQMDTFKIFENLRQISGFRLLNDKFSLLNESSIGSPLILSLQPDDDLVLKDLPNFVYQTSMLKSHMEEIIEKSELLVTPITISKTIGT